MNQSEYNDFLDQMLPYVEARHRGALKLDMAEETERAMPESHRHEGALVMLTSFLNVARLHYGLTPDAKRADRIAEVQRPEIDLG